jgi:ribosome biogenesis GTPase
VGSLTSLGWNEFFASQLESKITEESEDEYRRWVPARVIWEGRERYRLSTGEAELEARLSGRFRHAARSRADLPVTGDWVLAFPHPGELRATIQRRFARQTRFSRSAAGRATEEQVVAANIDTALIVTSINRDLNARRIERYLALAWESGARPVLVLNKADLVRDPEEWRGEIERVSVGVPLLVTSAVRGDGIAQLAEIVRTGGTTALLGSSGAGKSTLLNALLGENRQSVLPTRAADDRGRHSTTARQLFCLPDGGIVIDTPGLRELQLWDADAGLDRAFEDIGALAAGCRFRDCSHDREPGCAVIDAVERGELPAGRLDSYRRLQREDDFLRSRHDEKARSERSRQAKQIAKSVRLQYRLRRR